MILNWQENSELVEVYQSIDEEAVNYNLRPITFLIATDRNFSYASFIRSLEESLKGSLILETRNLLHLFVAHNDSEVPLQAPEWLKIVPQQLKSVQKNENNIGAMRICQTELATQAVKELQNPILVVMDDDLRFESLTVKDTILELSFPFSYVHELYLFHKKYECDVALGGVTGSPPLPATSSIRTFIGDILSDPEKVNKNPSRWHDIDYYYDLSETRETWEPWSTTTSLKGHAVNSNEHGFFDQMFLSGPRHRPLVLLEEPRRVTPQKTITRGGNTIIFNHRFLTEIEHPKLRRRGDSIWAILASEKGARILAFPAPLYHDRANLTYTYEALERRMTDDLFGTALQRAMTTSLEDFEFIFSNRISRQEVLLRESISLLEESLTKITKARGVAGSLWAMKRKMRERFIKESMNILKSLLSGLEQFESETVEMVKYSNMLVKSLRYDLQRVVI
jgi:hypothetical protein